MNIIIVGCGKIGETLTAQLCREGHNVSVIDWKRERVENAANKYDVMGVFGNGASHAIQAEAGLESAELLIAVTGLDERNLLCCLIAKKLGNCHTIARVQNPVYSIEIGAIKDDLGLSMTVNPEYMAAVEIARIFRFPSAIKIETFARGRVEILKYKIQPGSKLNQFRLIDISSRLGCDVLVCAVERGDDVIIPKGSFVLQEGDTISIVATPKKAGELFRKIGLGTSKVKNTMLVGGGGISYYLTRELLNMGIDVTIIEKDEKRCEFLSEEFSGALVIHGDAIDQSILIEEGMEKVESFAALTNMDEENVLLSLFAKTKSNAKLITKVHKVGFDEIIHAMDLGSIICPKMIVAENIIQYVRAMQNSVGSNVETLYKIIENKAEALEFIVRDNSPVIGVPLEKLRLKDDILVACINHKGNIIIPKGQDVIREGDSVLVVTTASGLDDISDILKR